MANFSVLEKEEKIKILQFVEKEIYTELYKNLSKLGYDPEVYPLNTWNFDEDSVEPGEDPEYHTKKAVTIAKSRLETIAARIVELS